MRLDGPSTAAAVGGEVDTTFSFNLLLLCFKAANSRLRLLRALTPVGTLPPPGAVVPVGGPRRGNGGGVPSPSELVTSLHWTGLFSFRELVSADDGGGG